MIDIHATASSSSFAINSVGVCDLQYPLTVFDHASEPQTVAARWRAGSMLSSERRGTHMSRFVEVLHEMVTTPRDLWGFLEIARVLKERLDTEALELTAEFLWFYEVFAPITQKASMASIPMSFSALIGPQSSSDSKISAEEAILQLRVPAKALCPCSKAISERGAHNQRSELSAILHIDRREPMPSLKELIQSIEACASSPVWPLLKRDDEKYVTERAYDHPAFVEDLVRAMADRMAVIPSIGRFVVEATNFESIHAHNCFAKIEHTKPGYKRVASFR